jgi:hypothetical protein
MDVDAMGMRPIPFPYGHPLVSAVIVIKGVAIARVAIAICRVTEAKERIEAKADNDVAMVVVMVRLSGRGYGNHAGPEGRSGNK